MIIIISLIDQPMKHQAKFVVDGIGISCELSAWQTILMKCQDLFSLDSKNLFVEIYKIYQYLLVEKKNTL